MIIEANTEELILLKEKVKSLADSVGGNFTALIREYGSGSEDKEFKEFSEIASALLTELRKLADGIESDVARRIEIIDLYNDAVYGHSV